MVLNEMVHLILYNEMKNPLQIRTLWPVWNTVTSRAKSIYLCESLDERQKMAKDITKKTSQLSQIRVHKCKNALLDTR